MCVCVSGDVCWLVGKKKVKQLVVRCLRGEVNREQKGCAHYDDTNFVEGVALFATGASGRERGTMKVFSLSCVYKNTIDVPFFLVVAAAVVAPTPISDRPGGH